MSFSNYLENQIIKTVFHAGDAFVYSPPATYYVGLSSGNPLDTASADSPPTGYGYARVALVNNYVPGGFSYPVSGVVSNSGNIIFPVNAEGGNWGELDYFTLWDASVSGNMLVYGALTGTINVEAGHTVVFQPGDLEIALDA